MQEYLSAVAGMLGSSCRNVVHVSQECWPVYAVIWVGGCLNMGSPMQECGTVMQECRIGAARLLARLCRNIVQLMQEVNAGKWNNGGTYTYEFNQDYGGIGRFDAGILNMHLM